MTIPLQSKVEKAGKHLKPCPEPESLSKPQDVIKQEQIIPFFLSGMIFRDFWGQQIKSDEPTISLSVKEETVDEEGSDLNLEVHDSERGGQDSSQRHVLIEFVAEGTDLA